MFVHECLSVSAVDGCNKLQEDLKRLEDWEREWLMEFHPAKCHVLRITKKKSKVTFPYTLHGHVLEEVQSAKYLGVTIYNYCMVGCVTYRIVARVWINAQGAAECINPYECNNSVCHTPYHAINILSY